MIVPTASVPPSTVPLEHVDILHSAVHRFIGARVKEAATADDLTQEVFVKVQKRIGQVRDPRRLMGWIIQIARNTVVDHFRGVRVTEPFDEKHFASVAASPGSHEREESRLREELSAYVRSVVEDLPAIYREAIVLTEFDGLSQVELARYLGLSVSAAKSRVQRARTLIRGTIERCCRVEVDRYGAVVECTPHEQRCGCEVDPRHAGRAR